MVLILLLIIREMPLGKLSKYLINEMKFLKLRLEQLKEIKLEQLKWHLMIKAM